MSVHEDEIPLTAEVVAERLVAQRPDLAECPLRILPAAGTTSHIVRIGDSLAARFPRRRGEVEQVRRDLEREQRAMAEFARASPLRAPVPEGVGDPGPGFPLPWTLQTWVPGTSATPRGLEHRATIARQLAALIGTLRDADPGERRFSGSGRGGRLADHDDWVAHCLHRSEHLLPVDRLRRMWERARCLPREDPDALCHGDLIPANLLVDGVDGTGTAPRLVGVLDTGGFGPADPALDLVVAWHLLDAERRSVLREQLRASDLQWARGAAWALEQALGLVWYYESTLPAMADLGRTTLGRLLEDPVLA
ncbi:phosphotransferase [Brachybacterium kimchii]|uniref:Phosphotransferase n=1 Tax=Brachybacterium kimchii TaxID=2942909 RepID=A0ABY4N5E6_9MICO|nr:phosphotransferase [Brachybacterium kimchii]UQN29364.1 phosphotransferase [Brachybacterium kimchii]